MESHKQCAWKAWKNQFMLSLPENCFYSHFTLMLWCILPTCTAAIPMHINRKFYNEHSIIIILRLHSVYPLRWELTLNRVSVEVGVDWVLDLGNEKCIPNTVQAKTWLLCMNWMRVTWTTDVIIPYLHY